MILKLSFSFLIFLLTNQCQATVNETTLPTKAYQKRKWMSHVRVYNVKICAGSV